MANYLIEKGIPIPVKSEPDTLSDLVKKMEIGDSVLVDTNAESEELQRKIKSMRFNVEVSNENEKIRIWKILK